MAGSSPGSGYVGREVELERLGRRLEETVAGGGGMVVLRGPSGIGATRTAHEVAARANRLAMVTLWGQTVDGLAGRPFGGIADALEEFGTSQPAANLRALLAGGAPALARMCPRLREVVPGIAPAATLDASDERLRLDDAVVGWLRRASEDDPLLLVLDDWQSADDDSRALLDVLAAASVGMRLLIVATESVAADRQPTPVPSAAEVIELPGLDEGAIGVLLAEQADRPLSAAALALIAQVSAGHPLFAHELYRHLREEDRLAAAQLPGAAELPATFEAVIAWRASRLPLETRTVINAICCFPRGVGPALLADVTGLNRARVVEVVERGVRAGLVRLVDRGQRYALYHDRVRQALLAAIPPRIQAAVHRRAAEALEAEPNAEGRDHAAELVDHLVQAAQLEPASAVDGRAVRHLLVAAEQARAAYAYRRASACLGHALVAFGEGRRSEYVELAARAAVAHAEAELAATAGKSVRELVTGQRRHGSLTRETWTDVVTTLRTLRYSGNVAGAAELARLALDQGAPRDEQVRRRLRLLGEEWAGHEVAGIASLAWRTDDSDAAKLLVERGDEADRADAYLLQRRRTVADTADLTRSVAGWHQPASLLRGLRAATSDLLLRIGQFRAGAAMAGRYLASAERFGALLDVTRALLLLARARAMLGELSAASQIIAAADEVIARLPAGADLAADAELAAERLLAELALAHYLDGDWPAALGRLDLRRGGPPVATGLELAGEETLAKARAGRHADARAAISATLEAVGDMVPLTYRRDGALFAALTAAWELGAAEHVQAGRLLLDRAAAAGAGGNHAATPRLASARLFGLIGDVDEARAEFAKERQRLDAAGLQPLRAILDHDEAVTMAAAGKGLAEASKLLEAAFRQFHGLGMAGWAERVEVLQSSGFEAAAEAGGRLHFSYPAGLSRPETDLVRRLAGGTSLTDAAGELDLDEQACKRLLDSALEKLGAANLDELPRHARRHGLGGA
jgi:hypothetical protein